ncbi:FecR family protein [Marinoscillum pacificum]|uniref:FecR family protein n=1 Tax=Marinoscillum pacificum TaxID=392723 RepID=UPI0021589EAE|nr:FecR domain-containing protein [Marinoscillum pacificum]
MANQDEHILRWLNGEITDDELKSVVGETDLSKYKQITSEIDQWEPVNSDQFRVDINDIFAEPKTITRKLDWWKPLSIAASVVAILTVSAWLLFFNNTKTYYADNGNLEVILPDGKSKATLSPGSELIVNRGKWKKGKRPVKMKGTALFEVDPGDPFTVEASTGTVAVLGTTFTVDVFDQSMEVICFEGKVRASTSIGEVIVNGGESYLFHDNQWEDMIPVTSDKPAWIQEELSFTNAPLKQVIKSLEKEFDITFDTGTINLERRYTGTFPKNNLNVALKIVFDPLGISFTIKDKKVTLSK